MEKETINNIMHPVEHASDKTTVSFYLQNALGFALPPVLPVKQKAFVKRVNNRDSLENYEQNVKENEQAEGGKDKQYAGVFSKLGQTYWQCPTKLGILGSEFLLPFDPVISISGKNQITRRYTSKGRMRGSIKEWWSMDDWDITISGVFMDDDLGSVETFQRELRRMLEEPGALSIINDVLNNIYDIRYIAVESYDFPFTKGVENQFFTLKAYSDNTDNVIKPI